MNQINKAKKQKINVQQIKFKVQKLKHKLMSLPIRQKSTKNILIHADQHLNQLKISQLITEPTINTFVITFSNLSQKYDTYNFHKHEFSQKITSMQIKYYDQSLILMENEIDFNDNSEYIKRFYFEEEFDGKIRMLGQYYKYHRDHPRIFLQGVQNIMTNYQQQQRELEYIKVREKIQQERQDHQDNQDNPYIKHVNSKKNIQEKDLKKSKKSQKILKNIQLSYVDFENKPEKKPKIQNQSKEKQIKRKASTNSIFPTKQKTLHKSGSLNIKHMFSSHSEQRKQRETSKNDSKRVFPLKQTQSKEAKNLQSKYAQIISELFKKKRLSSKNTGIDHNIQHKIVKNIEAATKQSQIHPSAINEPIENSTALAQNIFNLENKAEEIKKMRRSKSHVTMNVCKSNKLLKTFKTKINQKIINLNSKPASNYSSKQTSRHKHEQKFIEKSLKRDKYSSNKSLRQRNQKVNQKPLKTVKIFQITKKDLVIDQNSQNNSVQKNSIKINQKGEVQKCKYSTNQNKENQNNEIMISKNKKRSTSFKPIIQFNSVNKRKETVKKPQKLPKTVTMFDRVLKSKIRG